MFVHIVSSANVMQLTGLCWGRGCLCPNLSFVSQVDFVQQMFSCMWTLGSPHGTMSVPSVAGTDMVPVLRTLSL